MRPRRPFPRLIVAALALYALLLQPFVVAATPVVASAGVTCHAASDDPGVPADPHHPCCAAACAVSALPSAIPISGAVSWPRRDAPRLAWGVEGAPHATGPPTHAASARGPPVV